MPFSSALFSYIFIVACDDLKYTYKYIYIFLSVRIQCDTRLIIVFYFSFLNLTLQRGREKAQIRKKACRKSVFQICDNFLENIYMRSRYIKIYITHVKNVLFFKCYYFFLN